MKGSISHMNSYDYGDGTAAALVIAALVFALFTFIVAVVVYILGSLGLKKIFEKAGVKNPNVAWIPFYSVMVLAKLADVNPWLLLIAYAANVVLNRIPVLGWIIGIVLWAIIVGIVWRTSVKLSKEPIGFTIFGAILFPIWAIVVGYGKSEPWKTGEANGVARPFWHQWGAFFQDGTTWSNVPSQGYPVAGKATPPAAPPAA